MVSIGRSKCNESIFWALSIEMHNKSIILVTWRGQDVSFVAIVHYITYIRIIKTYIQHIQPAGIVLIQQNTHIGRQTDRQSERLIAAIHSIERAKFITLNYPSCSSYMRDLCMWVYTYLSVWALCISICNMTASNWFSAKIYGWVMNWQVYIWFIHSLRFAVGSFCVL